MAGGTVLIADDDSAIRTVLNQAFARAGYAPRATGNAATLWRWVAQGEGDVVITDVVMPDENAFDLIPRIKKLRPDLPIIVMSAQNTLDDGAHGGREGRLRVSAQAVRPEPDRRDRRPRAGRAGAAQGARATPEADAEELPLIGRSPAMQEIYRVLARLTRTDLTVMITGESGTGKELVARVLHDYGKRRNGPFVAINMAAIPRELIESELFGHEKGAFTGAQARTEGPVPAGRGRHAVPRRDRRHADGGADAAAARAAGGRVHHGRRPHADQDRRAHHRRHPPRARDADPAGPVPRGPVLTASTSCRCASRRCGNGWRTWATWCATSCAWRAKAGLGHKSIETAAIERLKQYHWPGNVRELENMVRRLAALHPEDTLTADIVEAELAEAVPPPTAEGGKTPKDLSEQIERYLAGHFSSYGRELPPPGLYDRDPAARGAPAADGGAGGDARQPDPGRRAARASTATRCARRSATSTSRCSARPRRDGELDRSVDVHVAIGHLRSHDSHPGPCARDPPVRRRRRERR